MPFVASTVRTIVSVPDFSCSGQISKMLLIVLLIGIDERAEARTALHAILGSDRRS
jgi:hypothetical protein